MAVILGIDPGSRTCGYGLINSVGNKLEYIASGCIRLEKLDFPRRLHTIFVTLGEIIEKYQPRTAAVEEMFLGKNAASAIKLGQARGAALVACSNQDVEIVEYSTRKVKQALVGTGAASKEQMQHMVTILLSLSKAPQADAADALSVAICHAHIHANLIKMAGVRSSRKRRFRG